MAEEDDDASKTISYLVDKDSSVLSPEGQNLDRAIDESNMGMTDDEEEGVPQLGGRAVGTEDDSDSDEDNDDELEVVEGPAPAASASATSAAAPPPLLPANAPEELEGKEEDQDQSAASDGKKNRYLEAKSLIVLTDFLIPTKSRKDSSATYSSYKKGSIKDEASLKKLHYLDYIAYKKLKVEPEQNVCLRCFDDVRKSLASSFKRWGQKGQGNLQTHLKTVHNIDSHGRQVASDMRSPSKKKAQASSVASVGTSSRTYKKQKVEKPMNQIFTVVNKQP